MRLWPFRRAEKRTITFQDLWGSGADTKLIHNAADRALHLVPVFAATRLLSDSIASLPLQTFRESGFTCTRIADPALLKNPTQYGTVYDWVHRAVTSLLLRGNAYGLVTARDALGFPTQIEWLDPDDVELFDNRTIAPPVWYYLGRRVPNEDFVHIPWYTVPGEVKGLSPIGHFKTTIETGLEAQQYGRDWFVNGAVPAAVLETDQAVTPDQYQAVKRRFKRAAEGRDVVVLGAGAKYKPISVAPDEAQFLQTIKATANQTAAIYGVPPEKIGGEVGHSMTYTTQVQTSLDFVKHSLRPYLVKLEWAISSLLPRGQYVKFNVDELLRADTLSRYQAHHFALTDGWKSRDEVRAEEDMAPLPDGQGTKPIDPSPSRTPAPISAPQDQPKGNSP